MKEIEQNISPLIESQFPSFYQVEGQNFVAFVKAYYEWLDQGGSESRNILKYRSIDDTVDEFLDNFKNEFLNSLPENTASDKRFLVKHIQDLYKSKGSSEAYKLFFDLVFSEDIEVYNPGQDVLRASHGVWIIPNYLECSKSDRAFSFIGKQITGASSEATAFVENVVRRKVGGKFLDIIYISNIMGNFQTGEYITDNNILSGSPYVVGSLNSVNVTSGGANNKIGDLFNITGPGGKSGKVVVRKTVDGTGKVTFTLVDGGYGFESNSQVIVSNAVVFITSNTGSFNTFESAIQPLKTFQYNTLTGANSFAVLDSINVYNSANSQIANGYVVASTPSNTTAGTVVISDVAGNWATVSKIRNAANLTITASYVDITDSSVTAKVVSSNNVAVGLYDIQGTLYNSGYIKAFVGEPLGLAKSNTTTNIITGNNTIWQANVGDTVYFRANNAPIGIVYSVLSNTSIQLVSNSLYTFNNATIWRTIETARANTETVYSSGTGATFSVGSLGDTQTIAVKDARLAGFNSGNVCFLDMLIDGSNANTAANAYGFSGNSAIGYSNGLINDALLQANAIIGRIDSLQSVNPGNNYNADPFVKIVDAKTSPFYFKDKDVILTETNNQFSPGQKLLQTIPISRTELILASNTGSFKIGEGVQQLTTGARGIVVSTSVSTVIVQPITNTSFVVSNNIIGQTTGANGAISTVTAAPTTFGQANGLIQAVSGNTLTIRDTSFEFQFSDGASVTSIDTTGTLRGSGTIGTVNYIGNPEYMGINAQVDAEVKTASGIVTEVEILDSGFGYSANEQLELTSSNTQVTSIFGTANVLRQGLGAGYWKDNKGKLNSDKYIHDNKYYQEYSYEIKSKMSLNRYSDILKNILHIAGTELFGRVIVQTEQGIKLDAPGAEITEIP